MATISLSVPVLLAASLVILIVYIWTSSTALISGGNIICYSACFNNLESQVNESDINPAVWQGNNSWSRSVPEIERQMKVQRSWRSSNSTSCEGRGIYVYELPSKFNDDLVGRECGMMVMPEPKFCKYLSNNGLGEAVEDPELGTGWHNTHQFALEPIFHARVLKHRCRVREWREAVLFYVPFYAGLDLMRFDSGKDPSWLKDALALELMRWLERQEAWRRSGGRDHVFVVGKVTWDFRRLEGQTWGNKFQELPQMQSPIKVLIEGHPWQINDVAVPYPTFFHPRTDQDIVAWQRRVSASARRSLVGFAGAARLHFPEIRSVLVEQCSSAVEYCRFMDCTKERCYRAETIVGFLMECEFCLQPPGDSPTRKSFFDSLVSGCIPVVFEPFAAHYQYALHLPDDWTKYSVYVDQQLLRNNTLNVVETLTNIPTKIREEMRRYIIYDLLPRLLYGDPQSELHQFQDAFSITMEALYGKISTFNTT